MSAPEHVGYVLKRFPRLSETFVAAELLEMRRLDQNVTVFALSRPAEPFTHRFLADLDVPVKYLPHRPLREPSRVVSATTAVGRRQPSGYIAAARNALAPPTLRGWRKLLQAAVLAEELRAAEVDHVHAHFASSAARLAHLAWCMGGPPFSVTAHAKDIYHGDVSCDRLASTLADAAFVATVSEDNVDYLGDLLDGRGRVELVPNAVDLSRITAPSRSPRPFHVLTVARLVEKKGLGDLVTACGILTARGTPVHLEVVGDGPMRTELEQRAMSLGVDTTFTGSLDHDDVVARYGRAGVFALPCVVAANGDRDGLPTAVLEAMACAVPVVTTAVNGLREAVIDGHTGLLVPEHDPTALADALNRVMADPTMAERLGECGRRRVAERFSLTASVARLRELFTEAAAGRAAELIT